jgi:hypothetical protein
LWADYFSKATVYGVDVWRADQMWSEIVNKKNIKLYTSTVGYIETFVKSEFIDKDVKFDMLLDDGPHSLESMVQFIQLYLPLLTDDGILIIEDVQAMDWLIQLSNVVPEEFKQYINTYDLRKTKGRYDDIVFTVNKSFACR